MAVITGKYYANWPRNVFTVKIHLSLCSKDFIEAIGGGSKKTSKVGEYLNLLAETLE